LQPIQQQYTVLLANINTSYDQIHYANSIVTGHLASVVEVHDTQNEILEKVDLKDYRTKVGVNASTLSSDIADLVIKSKQKNADLEKLITKFEKISKSVK
jgi:hypothetical protein